GSTRRMAGWSAACSGPAAWPSGSASSSGPGRWRWTTRPRRCGGWGGSGMAREKLGDDDQATGDSATVRELIDAAHRNAVDALADLRDLARGIPPPVLDNGLASALATLSASSAIPATVSADIATRPAPAIETIAYFCAAELMANATKHSYANQIKIDIHTD